MSHLKALKLASATPPRASADPVQRAREKAVEFLAEQKAMATAKAAGVEYVVFHDAFRKNEEGQRIKVKVQKRTRQAWFADAAGKIFFTLRCAGKTIDFAKDRNAIEVGELAALPAIIDTLVEAVRNGELDAQLSAAAAERGKMLRKAK